MMMTVAFAVLATLAGYGPASAASREDGSTAEIIQARVDQVRNGATLIVDGRSLASTVVLPDFYERRHYRPAWSDPRDLGALIAAVRDSASDGLLPEDYHLGSLLALREAPAGVERDADLDLLATDALVRLGYHLRFGKVDPARIDHHWNFRRDDEVTLGASPAAGIEQALEQDGIGRALEGLRPQHRLYTGLRAALAQYRRIEEHGGWPTVPAGSLLEPGTGDVRVPVLRRRLAIEGDLPPGDARAGGTVHDAALEAGVRRFQQRHGLTPDGVVGPATLRAMNVPVGARIDQIRLALEQGRLLLRDLPERMVVVNVPAFRVYYVDGASLRFAANVVVGKPYTKTPIFRAEINQVVVNPSWTIPPGIMAREVDPGVRRDPSYLRKKGFKRVGGQVVQPPGPNNALGRVKINFPNPHLVYLHDTPQQDLFDRDTRAFSSGCIRVQNAVQLAALLLDDPERWSVEALRAAIDTGRTRIVPVERTVPVLLVYWTAAVGLDEGIYFYEDVYTRDPALLRALDGPFRFDRRVAKNTN